MAEALSSRKIGYLEVSENFSGDASDPEHNAKFFANLEKKNFRAYIKPKFTGAYIANFSYNFEKANAVISAGEADLVSFGSLYIANPDLVERFASGRPLNSIMNVDDPSKLWTHYLYGAGPEGYTDVSIYEPKN